MKNEEFGQVFVGTKGVIFVPDAYCGATPRLFPESLMTRARKVERNFPRVIGGPTQELCHPIRGEGPKPVSNFVDHSGPLTEMVLVGNLAVSPGKMIDWNAQDMKVRGLPEVDDYLKRKYRAGWEPSLT